MAALITAFETKPRAVRLAYDTEYNLIALFDYRYNEAEQRLAVAEDLEGQEWLDGGGSVAVRGSKPWRGRVPEVLVDDEGYLWRVELAGEAGRKHVAALVHRDGSRIEPTHG